jgi:hypothetical protein
MTRTLTALAAAATIAIVAVAAPQQAEARHGGWGPGIVGGLAAGAIIGGALAGPRYYGGYQDPYYGGYSGYQEPYYGGYAYSGCTRYRVMTPYGWRWHRACY